MKTTIYRACRGGLISAATVAAVLFVATSVNATFVGDFQTGPSDSWFASWTDTTGGKPMDKWEALITGGGASFDQPLSIGLSGWTGTLVNPTYSYGVGPANGADRTITLHFADPMPSGGIRVDMLVWYQGSLVAGESWRWTNLPQQNGWELISDPSAIEYNRAPIPEPTTMIAGALLLLPFGLSTVRMLRRKA